MPSAHALLLLVLSLWLLAACQSAPAPTPAPTPTEELRTVQSPPLRTEPPPLELAPEARFRLAELLTRLNAGEFGTGAALSLYYKGEAMTIYQGTRGPSGELVTPDTQFNVASISKTVTASAVMRAVHEGKMKLSDPISAYLPGVHVKDKQGQEITAEITIERLLRHSSGLPHWPGQELDPAVFQGQWQSPQVLQKLTQSWTVTAASPPGTFWYSNLGYALLGAALERVQGCAFADCMRAHLDSMALPQASFHPEALGESGAHGLALREGQAQFLEPGWYQSGYAAPFTGAWFSAPALRDFGVQLLLASAQPGDALHAMTQAPSGGLGYGYGLIHAPFEGQPAMNHDGSGPGFLARVMILPRSQLVMAVVCNGGKESREQGLAFGALTEEMLRTVLVGVPR